MPYHIYTNVLYIYNICRFIPLMDCGCILCKHFAAHFINLLFRQPTFKLQQNAKNKGCMECTVQMHAWVVGPRSLVEGQHVLSWHRILVKDPRLHACNCRSQGSMHEVKVLGLKGHRAWSYRSYNSQ